MPKLTNSYRHLKPEDRMTIASLMQQNYSQEQLDAITDEINNRPRKGLGVRSPSVFVKKVVRFSKRLPEVDPKVRTALMAV